MTPIEASWDRSLPPEEGLRTEWLLANGLGGYASGTLAGPVTWRYHSLLVAALPPPLGRVSTVSHLDEDLGGIPADRIALRLELGLPVWRLHSGDAVVERRIALVHGRNLAVVTWRLLTGSPQSLSVRPWIAARPHDVEVDRGAPPTEARVRGTGFEVHAAGLPPIRLLARGGELGGEPATGRFAYPREGARGYAAEGALWSPGRVLAELLPETGLALLVSVEGWEELEDVDPAEEIAREQARRQALVGRAPTEDPFEQHLVLAADAFLVDPPRPGVGERPKSVIAGYPWFTDWGRDTMISLEGLTLAAGRADDAGRVLRSFAAWVRDGLVPNLFPEHGHEGLYHTADASLWFFHAADRYVQRTGDEATRLALLPVLDEIANAHLRGTRFGIGVDEDGLLTQGAPGFALTWMDARLGDWVVTPRRGKAVELSALWYQALQILADWHRRTGSPGRARELEVHAERTRDSFQRRFWNERTSCLFDVVDGEEGDDPAIRPNQVFALSLPWPVLDPPRHRPVLDVIERELWTPVGLRTLCRGHPQYAPRYDGDLRARDAAYHQGTVWAWLAGPYADARRRVHGDRASFDGLRAHLLGEACLGTVSEIFDAEPPYAARGCVAQAWSVAELLRTFRLGSGGR